jgi:exodeoxyribonuclease VII small subunit
LFEFAQKMATKSAPQPGSAPAIDFDAAVKELEDIVASMESGSLSLEHSLQAYKRGAELVKGCRQTLVSAQQQVKILEGDLLRTFDAGGLDDADEADQ